jgi:hypothetical protein
LAIVPGDGQPISISLSGKQDRRIALTRTWDYHAKSNHRSRSYESYYSTWEQFLAQADGDWTLSFLAWADECVEHGWGLYLDY